MTASPTIPSPSIAPQAAPAWIADGVRHQLLMRVLPVQRHDVLGPLSVTRMGLAIVKRRLAGQAIDAEGLANKVVEAESQVVDAVQCVAALRWWDPQLAEPLPIGDAMARTLPLLRMALSLRGHQLADAIGGLRPDQAADEMDLEQAVDAPDVLYVLLGVLAHAADVATQPTRWQWGVTGDGVSLWSAALPTDAPPDADADEMAPAKAEAASGAPVQEAGRPSRGRAIDAAALQALLDDCGWRWVTREPGHWRLCWPAPGAH